MTSIKKIHWFRRDLRLSDNPSLLAAVSQGELLPIFIYDDVNCKDQPLGAASRCWLHHALSELNERLDDKLLVLVGDPRSIIIDLVKQYNIEEVHWNRCYEPWQMQRDTAIKTALLDRGVSAISHQASLLWEPWDIKNKSGSNYKVFTPFFRKGCLQQPPPREPKSAPKKITYLSHRIKAQSIESLGLLSAMPWENTVMSHWRVGERAAKNRLKKFISDGLSDYAEGRNFPAQNSISRLSPYLHWGGISPHQVWYEFKKLPQNKHSDTFLSEIAWREFSYSLLYYNNSLPTKNLQEKFNRFPWKKSKKLLSAWQRGMTGYPIVDAGMRELWQTGFMHNRIRMVVASFLVKNLMIHWREGEKWFWDCLFDADMASNSANWQWVAGCGADAAPFFRIFNPVTQGKKFDPQGDYTKQYVPELSSLPEKYLFSPWEAPDDVLLQAGVKLGDTYPKPIIDLRLSRQRALEAYKRLK
ncbi:MAG: deoxyribodipyrimidine photo-lyase [Coxiellaceae bacterium]|nr:deoxyribodipyrimidine photo-lyase [Coxiellaceae bacterium]